MAPRKKVIIDTDMGADDATAILMVLEAHKKEQLDVVAINTVSGNTKLQNANKNALRLLLLAGMLSIPVYPGASNQLLTTINVPDDMHWYGLDGFGNVGDTLETPDLSLLQKDHAAHAIVTATENIDPDDTLALLCLGPLTNIAIAMELSPNFTSNVDAIYVMGGNIGENGNVDGFDAEYNFWYDPEAAFIALNRTQTPIRLVTMETTDKINMTFEERESVMNIDTKTARFINAIEELSINKSRELKVPFYNTYDQLAASWMLDDLLSDTDDNQFVFNTTETMATVILETGRKRGKLEITRSNGDGIDNIVLMQDVNRNTFVENFQQLFSFTFV